MLKVLTEINGSFCSAPPVFHPHCSLPSLHRLFTVLCAGVRSTSPDHLQKLNRDNQKLPAIIYSAQIKEETLLQCAKVFISYPWRKKETRRHKPDENTDQTCYHYDAGTLGIENLYFLSAILILFHPWILKKRNTICNVSGRPINQRFGKKVNISFRISL